MRPEYITEAWFHTNKCINSMPGDMKIRISDRRIPWMDHETGLYVYEYNFRKHNNRLQMLEWIDTYTNDRFYLGGSMIGFESDKDAVMFKLAFKNET